MDEQLRERANAVMEALGVTGRDFPITALRRLITLVNGEPIVYADAEYEPDQPRRVTGTAVIFTASRVIRADLRTSPLEEEPNQDASTVSVHVWSRHLLSALDLDEGADNSDWAWHQEWTSGWPHGARVQLTYSDGTWLRLPLGTGGRDASQMSALLPGLLEDLSSP